MKSSFSLIEILLVLLILLLIGSSFNLKFNNNNLDLLTKRLELYIKQTRYKALLDSKKEDNILWHKKRWTLKFFRCNSKVGGIYYSIYNDTNMKGHPNLNESLKDPLTQKRVYSTNKCTESHNTSKYVLLTKQFNITDVQISCNNTSSLGQLSFGNDGNVYTKLGFYENHNKLTKPCIIKLISDKQGFREILIHPHTGFIENK